MFADYKERLIGERIWRPAGEEKEEIVGKRFPISCRFLGSYPLEYLCVYVHAPNITLKRISPLN